MIIFYGNKNLLTNNGIGICGSIYPSEYAMHVIGDFVKKQKNTLVFHDEKGIARHGIRCAKLHNKKVIIISKYKSYIDYSENSNILYIWIKNQNEELYLEVFQKCISKLAVIELAKSSRLMIMIDNLIESNTEIYVIPGQIYTKQCSGSNMLIADGANLLYDELEI